MTHPCYVLIGFVYVTDYRFSSLRLDLSFEKHANLYSILRIVLRLRYRLR